VSRSNFISRRFDLFDACYVRCLRGRGNTTLGKNRQARACSNFLINNQALASNILAETSKVFPAYCLLPLPREK
jgi:hypothetical protein